MDIKRSPVVTDGPEYSRISDSVQNRHWYAKGHTPPNEVEEEMARRLSFREEEERKQREANEQTRREEMEASEERRRAEASDGATNGHGKRSDQSSGDEGANNPQDRIPGSRRRNSNEREESGVNGDSADDEGSPPSGRSPGGLMGSPQGAHYIPVSSIQDAEGDQEPTGSQSSPPSLPRDWSQPTPDTCFRKYGRFVTSPACFVLTTCMFAFAFFSYMVLVMWLEPNLTRMITEKVVLRPGAMSSPHYPNANIRLEVYFYNVSFINGTEGNKIHTTELGPYTYLVESSKTDVTWNSNSTVSYRLKETFHFKPNHSRGDQNDVVNTVNANILSKLSKMDVKGGFYVNTSSFSPDDFMTPQTVGDILWGGNQHRSLKSVTKKLHLLEQENESMSPIYNLYTGNTDIGRLNKMYTFNHSRTDRMWPHGHDHYPMSGTADGDYFSPMLKKDQDIAMFYSQTERNLLLRYQKSVAFKGNEAYRYVLPVDMDDVHAVPKLAGPVSSGNSSLEESSRHDVISLNQNDNNGNDTSEETFTLQYLKKDSPIQVSFPRSYERSYGNDSVCKMYLDIHPASGITLRKRLCHQMSLPIVYPGHDHSKGLRYILPVMWVDWFYESVPDDLGTMVTSYSMLQVVGYAKVTAMSVMFVFGGFLLFQIIVAGLHHCYCRQRMPVYYNLENRGPM